MPDPSPQPLTYSNEQTETRWVLLGKFHPLEAQLAVVKLRSEGIPCNLADQNAATMYSAMIGIDVRLEVLAQDLERAREILQSVRAQNREEGEGDYLEEDWRCSRCRARNVGYVPLGNVLRALSLLLLGLPLLFMPRRKICRECGHTWDA